MLPANSSGKVQDFFCLESGNPVINLALVLCMHRSTASSWLDDGDVCEQVAYSSYVNVNGSGNNRNNNNNDSNI